MRQPDEFARLLQAVAAAHRKWTTGIFMLRYPVKDRRGPDDRVKEFKRQRIGKLLQMELVVGGADHVVRLRVAA